ncbi:hypothetical protein HTV80_33620 [Streptomyces sp. Vc74B-19]|uniref:hypothetical protein n=1 Tax=Streptomyces sp. Vc74B-19 TaxID=2741324 RepID=UPI001BFBF87E|nr:hypothetical protein [Streptomyces sp. Vc74B-19]MBT3167991.1 hypothetical protein [Streptomyces sp. Vc74B-19]
MTDSFDLFRAFESLAAPKLRAEDAARARLAECMRDFGRGVDTSLVREAMLKAAIARPYREVTETALDTGTREAIDRMRKSLARQLLTRAPGGSTCQINNEATRMEIEAAQNFLANAEGLLEYAAETEEAEADAPAGGDPAPADAAKIGPVERRTLEAIRDNGTAFWKNRAGGFELWVERGYKPRKDMIEWAVSEGYAERDTTADGLLTGQAVTLTDLGHDVLDA